MTRTFTRNKKREAGQGMTEYIIIVALIAVAAIGIYGVFGETLRQQMGDLTAGLAGENRSQAASTLQDVETETAKEKGLGNYNAQ